MNIVLGVSGGIAAYKAVSLARLFVEAGHEVHVVPTADALKFVGRPTWEAISRNPVTTSVHDDAPEVRHVALGQRADLVVVAPATANTLAKMTAGLADDLLGTTLLTTHAPVLVAPAMHTEMWAHPATQHNISVLRERGVTVVGPESGRLTGTDTGIGRMSEPETIFERAELLLSHGEASLKKTTPSSEAHSVLLAEDREAPSLVGLRVLVSAGGTREPIDPVRYLGNRSSGRQGIAVAAAAAARGAKVTLVTANIDRSMLEEQNLTEVHLIPVGSAAELQQVMTQQAPEADVIVMAAAVADYRVAHISEHKLRKEEAGAEEMTLSLRENPDILRSLVEHRRSGQLIVGFAAETAQTEEELLERGRRKVEHKGCDLLAVNRVGWQLGFETSNNELVILTKDGSIADSVEGSKRQAAETLLDVVAHTIETW